MAWSEYDGLTEDQLLAAKAAAQQELLSGKTITSAGSGGTSASMALSQSIKARIRAICRALYAISPTRYSDPGQPITVARVSFSDTEDSTESE